MRIAMINTFYKPTFGGVEMVMEELATRYVKEGHQVDIFCSDSDKYETIKKKFEIIDGVRIFRSRSLVKLSLNTHLFPGYLWNLLWNRYDIVHTHRAAHDFVLFAGLIAFLKGRKHVNTTHCCWTDKFRPLAVRIPLFFTDRFLNYISFFFCDKIIAITPWEIPILEKWVSKKKVKVIRNGMDSIFFKKVKNNQYKKNNKIAKGKLALFFGRLHPTKAPHVLAEVAKELVHERKDISFAFVGPDEGEMDKVKKIVKGEKKIHVLGGIRGKENIAEMYQASDVYVLPSYREGLPLTIFEAMASGLPIVATPCNGVPYEVKDGENGFLVEYGNRKLLKEKILEVLDNPKLAKKFSKTNKEKAKDFTWDQIAKETLDLYREVIDK